MPLAAQARALAARGEYTEALALTLLMGPRARGGGVSKGAAAGGRARGTGSEGGAAAGGEGGGALEEGAAIAVEEVEDEQRELERQLRLLYAHHLFAGAQ